MVPITEVIVLVAPTTPPTICVVYALFRPANPSSHGGEAAPPPITDATELLPAADPSLHLAQCFLRLANLPNYALDRLSRCEFTLWRQVAQILFALENLTRRKPQEREPLTQPHSLTER